MLTYRSRSSDQCSAFYPDLDRKYNQIREGKRVNRPRSRPTLC